MPEEHDSGGIAADAVVALFRDVLGIENLCIVPPSELESQEDASFVSASAIRGGGRRSDEAFAFFGGDIDAARADLLHLVLPLCGPFSVGIAGGYDDYDVDNPTTTRRLGSRREEQEVFITVNVLGAAFCVACVAVIAGLFLGLLTLDKLDLQIIQRASMDADERRYATALLPVIEQRHLVLVTLLILNALAYETLPIFLDNLVPSWVAILLSSTVVMVFGEIIPSGIFMGPQQLYLGYHMVRLAGEFLSIVEITAAFTVTNCFHKSFTSCFPPSHAAGTTDEVPPLRHVPSCKAAGTVARLSNIR